jgi:glucose-6-phosphate 1-dehydrogenase
LYYLTGDFGDKSSIQKLKELARQVDKDHSTHGNYFYYLATRPSFFGPIVEQLAAVGLMEGRQSALAARHHREALRHDLESARR